MTEADCQLFQERLPQWQERLLNRLCDEYAALLTGPYRGSEAFWEVKRLIRKDMKRSKQRPRRRRELSLICSASR